MAQRTHRVLRKAARVEKDELDSQFDDGYGAIVKKRNTRLQEGNVAYSKAVALAKDALTRERDAAWREFESARNELLKELSKSA